MGFYIETDSPHDKVEWILKNCKGSIQTDTPQPGTSELIPVIVINNYFFEAAGIAFDKKELEEFTDKGDFRSKSFLLVPRSEVIRLVPRVEQRLKW